MIIVLIASSGYRLVEYNYNLYLLPRIPHRLVVHVRWDHWSDYTPCCSKC